MALGNFTSNQGTQTPIVVDTIGGGSVIALQKVDISPAGAAGTIWNGTVGLSGGTTPNLAGGTVNVATVTGGTLNNLASGTINAATAVLNSGTINVGSFVMTSGTPNGGTVNVVGTINNLLGGTLGNLNFGSIALSDGTTKANIMASGVSNGTGAMNAQLFAGGLGEFLGTATGGAADLIASFDVSNYCWAALQIAGTFVGTVNIGVSNDNLNFQNQVFASITQTNNGLGGNINSNNIYLFPIMARYMRIRSGAWTSGTAYSYLELHTLPNASLFTSANVSQNGVWNVGGTVFNQALTAFGTFLGTTGAVTGTTIMGTTTGLGTYRSMNMFANLQGAGGTAKTDIYLQTSPDGGVTWVDYAHYTQLAASATSLTSFTTSKGANAQQAAGMYTVGTGNVPALGAGSIIGGDWGDRLRYIAAIGAGGTNAGTCIFNIALTT